MKYVKLFENFHNIIDDNILEKSLKRVGKRLVIYKNVKIYLESNREDFSNTMNIFVGDLEFDGQMDRELVVYDKTYDIYIEDILEKLKEKIKECYESFIDNIKNITDKKMKIKEGYKNISIEDIKNLLLYSIPKGYIGRNHKAVSGSQYIIINNKEIRFSDHMRPPNSYWNTIHGGDYDNVFNGLKNKNMLYVYINKLLNGKITKEIKSKIDYYFDNKIKSEDMPNIEDIKKKYYI